MKRYYKVLKITNEIINKELKRKLRGIEDVSFISIDVSKNHIDYVNNVEILNKTPLINSMAFIFLEKTQKLSIKVIDITWSKIIENFNEDILIEVSYFSKERERIDKIKSLI